jgi:pimeloyl-ACP methyl ester carboxylesterase
MTITNDSSAITFETRLGRFPLRTLKIGESQVSYREAGKGNDGPPIVLLHGIGSGSASWVQQFEALGEHYRVLAWDAPGYGESTPVLPESPIANDYAFVLTEWLDALQLQQCVLIGHSLGAIIAGAFTATRAERVCRLLLISPACGYGAAGPSLRTKKRDGRLALINDLGPEGLAEKRSRNMLSDHASQEARDWVKWNMSRVIPAGYRRATHLLSNADLVADLQRCGKRVPIEVAVGEEDTITPPENCEKIANAAETTLQVIKRAGHAGYIEAPEDYNLLISKSVSKNKL